MSDVVKMEVAGDVAVLVIDNPPVNALGHAVRAGLMEAITAAEADARIRAVVIRAAGRTFPAGADITEFGKPPSDPSLPYLCNRIEACAKPVVAAIHGTALGGGLELALAAHYRIALEGARLGLPEVTLGILPGAGGTQRTPRLIGAKEALGMMISGKPVTAAQGLAMGLIDGVVEDHLPAAATELARMLAEDGSGARRTRERSEGMRDPVAYEAAVVEARRAHAADRLPGPSRIVDCVEAALLLPFDQGLLFERAAFTELVGSEEAAGLRHAFFAERAAAKVPEAAATPRAIAHVGVVGAGQMGVGITVALLQAGLRVTLVDRDRETLAKGLERVAQIQERGVETGRQTAAARDADWARLAMGVDLAALGDVDLAIEAVYEDELVKAGVMEALGAILRPGAVLATNTSYLDVDVLAAMSGRPADVVGLHFFSPAHVMRLLEVVAGRETAPQVVATGLALARRMGKVAVRSGVCDGFIGNRVLTAYRTAADFLLEDGATPAQIDGAMRAFGFPLGPYQVLDLAGLEISWARRRRLAESRDPGARYVAIGDRLCEAGWIGQKAGRGYYLYDQGREGRVDPEVLALIEREREVKGIVARPVGTAEIVHRCLAAMANEGARILGEGIALRPSDVDVVMLAGFGFPRWRGGPMHWADQRGLLVLRKDIRAFADQAPEFWRPAPLLDVLIRDGRKFADLNA